MRIEYLCLDIIKQYRTRRKEGCHDPSLVYSYPYKYLNQKHIHCSMFFRQSTAFWLITYHVHSITIPQASA